MSSPTTSATAATNDDRGGVRSARPPRSAGSPAPVAASAARIAAPTARPPAPPSAAGSSASIRSCRATWNRPAPSARRVASSRRRALARASDRLAMLMAPISSTNAGARPEQIERAPNAARQRFLQRRHGAVHAELGVAELRKPLDVGRMQRVELRLHLLERSRPAGAARRGRSRSACARCRISAPA